MGMDGVNGIYYMDGVNGIYDMYDMIPFSASRSYGPTERQRLIQVRQLQATKFGFTISATDKYAVGNTYR